MKTKVFSLMAGILLVALACNLGAPTQASTQPGVETIVAATVQAFKTDLPPTEVVQPSGTPVSFQNVSFVIPEGVATGADAKAVPAQTEAEAPPWDVAPEHIVFSFTGWSKEDTNNMRPTMMVFPAQEYADANPGAGQSLPALKELIANSSASLTVDSIPPVPYYNAAQTITAQSSRLDFQSGSGIRTVTFYAQFPGPILKDGQFYYYQGLTSDGQYYVIATLPIVSPLKSTADNPSADGPTYPDPSTVANPSAYDMYYPAMMEILDAASPDSFSPSLNQIDALIQSITVASQ